MRFILIDKFEIFYDMGVRQFALLADDASSETPLQVKTINALQDWLDTKEGTYPLVFCPQAYSGYPSESYFNQFRDGTSIEINGKTEQVHAIDERVEIMFTGPAIKLFVAEDQSANLLKKGAIKLSADGENWTTVREFNIVDQSVTDSDDTYDVHEAPYFYIDEDVSAAVYYGDINGNGNVDVDDGTALQKYLVGAVELSEAQLAVADTNHDDKITVSDATQVQLIVAGKSEAEASGTEGGYIEYTINKEVELNPFTFTVIQNSETISNAKVEVKVYGTDEYVELGTLDKSICDFTLDPQTQVVRISWDAGEEFFIHEMFY